MLDQAFMSSFNHEVLKMAKSKCSELLLAPERLPDDAPPDPLEAVRQAQSFPAPVLQHQYAFLTAEVVYALHDDEIAVWSWPTDDEASLVLSIELGADAVMGDDVQLMLEILNRPRPV
jgi:glycerophosphoryl diester phosphodiesterase